MGSFTLVETFLAVAVFLLAWYELAALIRSRREGLTRNRSRAMTLSLIMALTVAYAIGAWLGRPIEGTGPIRSLETPTVPWTFLVIGGMMALVAAFEAAALVRARMRGLTTNVSRLVSYSVMFIILLAMLSVAMGKWESYLDRLDQTREADAGEIYGR